MERHFYQRALSATIVKKSHFWDQLRLLVLRFFKRLLPNKGVVVPILIRLRCWWRSQKIELRFQPRRLTCENRLTPLLPKHDKLPCFYISPQDDILQRCRIAIPVHSWCGIAVQLSKLNSADSLLPHKVALTVCWWELQISWIENWVYQAIIQA